MQEPSKVTGCPLNLANATWWSEHLSPDFLASLCCAVLCCAVLCCAVLQEVHFRLCCALLVLRTSTW
jgi:hypothetical protein